MLRSSTGGSGSSTLSNSADLQDSRTASLCSGGLWFGMCMDISSGEIEFSGGRFDIANFPRLRPVFGSTSRSTPTLAAGRVFVRVFKPALE